MTIARLFAFVVFLNSTFVLCLAQQDQSIPMQTGYWQFSEAFRNKTGPQNAIWSFEFHVDRASSTVTGVGRRSQVNGERVRDRSTAIIFLDRQQDDNITGTYIEAYGDGEQVEISLTVELSATRKKMKLTAFNDEEKQVTQFHGEWIGRGAQAKLQPGKWIVREVVSPKNGNYDIEWSYRIEERAGKLSGTGNKSLVNNEKADQDESNTVCSINLSRGGGNLNTIAGSGLETHPNGSKTKTEYQGWVSPSGRAFFLMSYEKDELAGLIYGRYAD